MSSETAKIIKDNTFVFVDLETSGPNPARDRIIEIALIKVKGGEVLEKWSTLINPETSISEFIQDYTGITEAMVADAPTFAEVAVELKEKLKGAVFVAHSVRFDYGFIKHSFGREEIDFNQKRLCTVKLSRYLYDAYRKHSLDALIERYGFECEARHRAMGDTDVLWQFWQMIQAELPAEKLEKAIKRQLTAVAAPNEELRQVIEGLDDTPGVYLFFGDSDVPLYVGKSVNLRSRVSSHFSGDHESMRKMRMTEQVQRIEVIDTAGDLGARLRESQLIKARQPIYNRQLRRNKEMCSLKMMVDENGYEAIEVVKQDQLEPASLDDYYGVFRNTKYADEFLREIAKEHQLCFAKLGVEKAAEGGCFAYRMLKRCQGACCGEEEPYQFNSRLREVLVKRRLATWDFGGRIGIREHNPLNKLTQIHVVDNWCYLGTVNSEEELYDMEQSVLEPIFDLDTYKILKSYMKKIDLNNVVVLG